MVGRYDCCGNCEYRELDYADEVYRCRNGRSINYGAMICYEDVCEDYGERESDKEHGKNESVQ